MTIKVPDSLTIGSGRGVVLQWWVTGDFRLTKSDTGCVRLMWFSSWAWKFKVTLVSVALLSVSHTLINGSHGPTWPRPGSPLLGVVLPLFKRLFSGPVTFSPEHVSTIFFLLVFRVFSPGTRSVLWHCRDGRGPVPISTPRSVGRVSTVTPKVLPSQ